MNRVNAAAYQAGSSPVHGLSAPVKLICILLLAAAVIAADSLMGFLLFCVVLTAILYLAELSFRAAFSSVIALIWFFVLIILMNLLFFAPEEPWVSLWIFKPSQAGLLHGIKVTVRVALVLVVGDLLTATTSPLELTDAIGTLLSPLRYIKIPTEQIAMILSVALRFIPILLGEAEMIRKAQTARGALLDSRKPSEKAAALMPLAVPVILAAFRRADELALAMEARGCRGDFKVKRRRWEKLSLYDYAALIVCLGLLGLEIVVLQSGV